jgi:hypothetical protein
MAIVGLTDQTRFNSIGRIEITVFKGDRKPAKMAGKDLQDKLRITTANPIAARILSKHYGQPNQSGDYIVNSVRVYFIHDMVDQTFATSMKSYSHSGLELECDRDTIYKKCVPTTDAKGNLYRPIQESNDPCPMRGQGMIGDCPNGCQKEGQLLFYIKELMDSNMMLPARMTVHGYEDIVYLYSKLQEFQNMFGKLSDSPFPSHETRHYIPFILTRTQVKTKRPVLENGLRTGKKADHQIWAVALDVDPDWMKLYSQWQMIQEMQLRGLQPSRSTVAGLLRGDSDTIIDIESEDVTPKALPPAPVGDDIAIQT